MEFINNGIFKFDYQFPIYNFFFPNQVRSVSESSLPTLLSNSNRDVRSRALYFHIPFCDTICTFCHFSRGVYKDRASIDEYVKALIKEVIYKSEFNDYKSVPIKAIFFGGGTPSLLSPENIRDIGEVIKKIFILDSKCEFSFEIEVKSLDQDKVYALKEIGVTHPRFGLQTFNEEWRRIFNLTSSIDQINYAADILNSNFDNVLFDIIYGMNGQDEEEIINDLSKAVKLNTSNIEIFPINNIAAQVSLHRAIKDSNKATTSATRKFSMRILIDAYMRSVGFMPHNGHGYVRTNNISNDTVTKAYNFKYHEHVYGYSDHDLHAFGVNAISTIRGAVITNTFNRLSYVKGINKGEIPCAISTHETLLDEMKPVILRLPYYGEIEKNKVALDKIPLGLLNKLNELKEQKLIEETDTKFYITKLGWYWYSNLMFYLMPKIDQDIMKKYITKQLNVPGRFISKSEIVYVK